MTIYQTLKSVEIELRLTTVDHMSEEVKGAAGDAAHPTVSTNESTSISTKTQTFEAKRKYRFSNNQILLRNLLEILGLTFCLVILCLFVGGKMTS